MSHVTPVGLFEVVVEHVDGRRTRGPCPRLVMWAPSYSLIRAFPALCNTLAMPSIRVIDVGRTVGS
jgi:hypothetical protein